MTSSTRFLLFLVLFTLIGCSSGDKPAAESDANKPSDANSNTSQAGTPTNVASDPSATSVVSDPKTELGPTRTLNLEKEFSSDLTASSAQAASESALPQSTLPENANPSTDPASSANPELPPNPDTATSLSGASGSHENSDGHEAAGNMVPNAPMLGTSAMLQDQDRNPLREGRPSSTTMRPISIGQNPSTPGTTPPNNDLRDDSSTGTLSQNPSPNPLSLLPSNSKMKNGPNSKGKPFDPVKENGTIFVDWPKPDLALVMTGRQNGYIEPCGCAGLERMKGGLTRRDSLLQDLTQKRSWPVVAVDVGNQVKDHKRQTELKFQHTAESLQTMGYDAIGLGIADLQLPAGELASVTSNEKSPFVSANVDLFEPGTELIEKHKIVERNGIKIGITAVLGNSFRKQLNNKSIPTSDPVAAIEKVLENLKQCEVRILLAYANSEESTALAKRFPRFNVVVTADGGSEPPDRSVVIPGTNTYLVEVGEKGSCAVVLGIYRDKDTPVRYQRVPLDSRFPTSERIHRLMGAYQDQLKMLGLEGLKIKPVPAPETRTKGRYIGSKACATCHEKSYEVWRKSKHAQAWKTLVDANPPRNHDPECISCHVVGWDPQRYYPFVGGFVSPEKTPELENVGCESCHGPGGAHATAEEGSDLDLQERLQKAMVVTIEESRSNPQKMCYNCHDLDNSPEFNFDKYWPEVKHYETDSGEKEDDE